MYPEIKSPLRYKFSGLICVFGIVCSVLLASTAQANGRGTATIYTCVSLVTEFEDGTQSKKPYKARFVTISTYLEDESRFETNHYGSGPTIKDAGSGSAYLMNGLANWPDKTGAEVLLSATASNIEYGWISSATPPTLIGLGSRLFYVRPASEVKNGHEGSSVTEFECHQSIY